ncbi:DUF3795 domain-containing protein [Kosmotoga pacifica]|uniref:DUF3795 domain-containing protein n=1 Tax=Kosmotoga pacifica TaxID=1330330 RepID=UPI0009E3F316|nr:DUF3795 domain-containing protein [Kosmotoga pacifica]
MRAYCGIDCFRCSVYIATINNDEKLREETAAKWRKEFHLEVESEDLVCRGCKSGRAWKMCIDCPFVKCCKERRLNNCGECDSYPCSRISEFLKDFSDEMAFLDQVHREHFPGQQ